MYLAIAQTGRLTQGSLLPSIAVGLHISFNKQAYGGGYAMRCAPNVETDNYVSLYICRDFGQDGLNNPGPPALMIMRDVPSQPVFDVMTYGTDSTSVVRFDISALTYIIHSGPHHCVINTRDNNDYHLEIAAITPAAGIVEGTMGVIGNGGVINSFRTALNCQGAQMWLSLQGTAFISAITGKHTPRILCLWTPLLTGTQWENGLGQINEAWVAFSNVNARAASIVGKFPAGLVVHKSLDPATLFSFSWDNKAYVVWTKNASLSNNTSFGTLCLQTDGTATNDCPGI
jgi:hypothetical protein